MGDVTKELGEVVAPEPSVVRMWQAMADRIKAGEAEDLVLADYGLRRGDAALAAMVADAERYRRLRKSALTVSFNQCIAYSPGYNERDAEAMDKFIDERLGLHDAAMAQRLERS